MIDKYLVAVLGSVFLFGCSLIQPIKEEVKLTADSKTVVPIVVSVYQPYSEKGGAGRYAKSRQHLLELGAPRDGEYVVSEKQKPDARQFVEFKLPPPRITITEKSDIEATLFFKSNSHSLSQDAAELIKYIGANKGKYSKISLSGHADAIGSTESNRTLSQNRIDAVVAELIKQGIPADSISGDFFGSEKPSESNSLAEGRAKNRRVEISVTGTERQVSNSQTK